MGGASNLIVIGALASGGQSLPLDINGRRSVLDVGKPVEASDAELSALDGARVAYEAAAGVADAEEAPRQAEGEPVIGDAPLDAPVAQDGTVENDVATEEDVATDEV